MKILLAQLLGYLFTPGGAHKANRILIEGLAERGHTCRVVASSLDAGPAGRAQLLDNLAASRIDVIASAPDVVVFDHNCVRVHVMTGDFRSYPRVLSDVLHEFEPDWTLVSEDRSFLLLEAALEASPSRVVYVSHSQATLPFGPESFSPDSSREELFRRAAGIISVSDYLRDYIKRWSGLDSTTIYFPAYGDGPFRRLGNFDRGAITLINPSAIKGLCIFEELARRLPDAPFAAVPTWATTQADRTALQQLPNVQLLNPSENIDDIFAQTRILLVPSLWGESFGQIVVEAMLRGIPTLASRAGGLPEAKLGIDYLLPIRPIERYEQRFDERRLPVPVVPPQDIEPWLAALRELLTDRARYEQLSIASRNAASCYVSRLGIDPFERYLATLQPMSIRRETHRRTPDDSGRRSLIEQAQCLPPQRRALLVMRLMQKKDGVASNPIARRPRSEAGDLFPLSFAQQRLWFLSQMEPTSPFYNIPAVFRLTGKLDRDALQHSLDEIVRRHEALRTNFQTIDGQPFQAIAPPRPVAIDCVDLRSLPDGERSPQAQRLMRDEGRRLFDLACDPLLRAMLVRTGDEAHQLLLTIHHIVCDGWSIGLLMQELGELYAAFAKGEPPPLPDLPIQYIDFACWQREYLQGETLAKHLAYWREQFERVPPALTLPGDRPRPAVATYRGAVQSRMLPAALVEDVDHLSRQDNATAFMTLLAAFQALLYRYSGQNDIVVGTPIANRNRQEIEKLVGFFVNALPLRLQIDEDLSFRELIRRVRQTALSAYAHQDLPLEKLIEELNLERNLSHHPLFQVMFAVQNMSIRSLQLADLHVQFIGEMNVGATRFDLSLYIAVAEIVAEYNTDLFDAGTIRRLLDHYQALLQACIAAPDAKLATLSLLPEAERQRLLVQWNDTRAPYACDRCIHDLLEAQAEDTPNAIAAVYEDECLSYRALNRRADRLAHYLRRRGAGPETRIGICVERSLDLIVGLAGILKAGGAYVPLDPTYPRDRIAFILQDAQVSVLLTQRSLVERLPRCDAQIVCLDADWPTFIQPPTFNSQPPSSPDNLAYVIYTSGSTGKPKGVQVSHRAVVNCLESMRRQPGIQPSDVLLSVTTFSFDIAALEIFLPLIAGARVVVLSRLAAGDGVELMQAIDRCQVTLVQATPATWRLLLEAGWRGNPRLKILCGGEALPRDMANELLRRSGSLWNMYGPTETTIWSCVCRVTGINSAVSIGRPIANTRVYVLDRYLRPVPIGVPGELYIGGDGLARGYLNRPDLTAERFVPNPFTDNRSLITDQLSVSNEQLSVGALALPLITHNSSLRIYRTGDLARWLPDGNIEFMGRLDHQVKVRGFRLEPGEIEAALTQHAGVRQALVVAHEDKAIGAQLIAYLTLNPETPAPIDDLKHLLREQLPDYMIPTAFAVLDEFPLTPNGKIDRRALPPPDRGRVDSERAFIAPGTPYEEILAEVWADVLARDRIGARDNFFEIGGHSLLAMRVIARVRDRFEIELPVRSIFESPTLAEMAARIERAIVAEIDEMDETEVQRLLV